MGEQRAEKLSTCWDRVAITVQTSPSCWKSSGAGCSGGGTITARQVQVTHDAEVILELTPALVRLKLKDGWLTILSERKKLSPTSFWTFVPIEQEAASPVSTARFAHTVSSTLVH